MTDATPGDAGGLTAGLRRLAARRLPAALAIGLGATRADAAYAGRIRAAQIAGLVRLTPFAMIASSLNATILLATIASVGAVRPLLVVWSCAVFALTAYYLRGRWQARGRPKREAASARALRAAAAHGALFGAVWGVVPVIAFPGAPSSVQLLVGCLTAGMMGGGGFVLATVPLGGCAYVAAVVAGSACALLSEGTAACLGIAGLVAVYATMVVINLCWNAQLFVEHFIAEAQLRDEVAAREQAQAQTAHAQRMTALGELAGGAAHDFNNVLQAVASSAGLIVRYSAEPAQVEQLARSIGDAAERGGAVSRRMLAFARQDSLRPEPVDAAALLEDAGELLRHSLGPGIVLQTRVAPGLPPLFADRPQLETVLVNLARNARDAMPRGGELTLSAEADGASVRLTVADTGTGMSPELLARATEPFFTTKPRGEGTGLGLPMAKGFAEQSGGTFRIDSAPGRGTSVSLRLPQSELPMQRSEDVAAPAPAVKGVRVLLVDDDVLVRETIALSLARSGLRVDAAGDGRSALGRLDDGAEPDVLVTDLTMPGMDGRALIRAARARRPGLPAILLTGQVDAETADRGTEVLHKPVRLADLLVRIAALAAYPRLSETVAASGTTRSSSLAEEITPGSPAPGWVPAPTR